MSRNFTVLSKASPMPFPSQPGDAAATATAKASSEAAEGSAPYSALIRLLFHGPAAVAIVGGSGQGASAIVESLAAELGASGKRVILVPVGKLLRMNPIRIPDEMEFVPGNAPRVWIWPVSAGPKVELFRSRDTSVSGNWLDALRRSFDAVLLDCPRVAGAPGITEVASMADATVLAVEAGHVSNEQIRQDQQALQFRGARVVGCILVQPS